MVVGTLFGYTLLQDCNHDHTWHIATVQLLQFSAVSARFTTHTAIKQTA
jgi:hypothetical protein